MDQSKINLSTQNSQKILCKQPISCPWITSQPYPSTLNKNRACESSVNKSLPSIPLSVEPRTVNEKSCPSLQHSSSQFFYFLRLMQLFPETHPATLHTVLSLCKNDFFCAVDKLLYAKRCKALYSRSQSMFKRCSTNRSHPYNASHVKNFGQQEKPRNNETEPNSNTQDFTTNKKPLDVPKVQIVVENNLDVMVVKEQNDDNSSIPQKVFFEAKSQLPAVVDTAPGFLQEAEKSIENLSACDIPQQSKCDDKMLNV